MAKYTMELRTVCELVGRDKVEEWFKSYDMYDYLRDDQIQIIMKNKVWNKNKLSRKIVDHYYMREIGFETIGLFQHYVKVRMQEIMEKMLPMIYSNAIKYDPLVNVDFTETFSREIENTGESTSESSNNSSGLGVNSDTPEGQITKADILAGNYASQTNASESESSTSDETNTSSNTVETYSKNVKGNSGVSATAQALLKQYRDNVITIDNDIIDELNVLFMGIY